MPDFMSEESILEFVHQGGFPVRIPSTIMLGIESSCDDTSIAVMKGDVVLSQFTAAQHIHSKYGGVVPEFASRAHQKHILPVLNGALEQAGCALSDVNGVAYTRGPGLNGSLLVGSAFARSLAWSLDLPMWPVHHMRAHVLAHWISGGQAPAEPMMALTVSGGHTQLVDVSSPWDLNVVGTTLDDAAGEAFDKVAKMIGLPYPGGPEVDRLAQEGDRLAFEFTSPQVTGLDFSFSGLKTSVLRTLEKNEEGREKDLKWKQDVCASLQHTIVAILVSRLEKSGRPVWAQGHCHSRRGQRKFRLEKCHSRTGRTSGLVGAHSSISILHRQWGHDCHVRTVFVHEKQGWRTWGWPLAQVADDLIESPKSPTKSPL